MLDSDGMVGISTLMRFIIANNFALGCVDKNQGRANTVTLCCHSILKYLECDVQYIPVGLYSWGPRTWTPLKRVGIWGEEEWL